MNTTDDLVKHIQDGGFKHPKFCIFCGKKPENKNNEHVIPRWLIEYTGDPKREVHLGIDWTCSKKKGEHRFSFDSFKFPACQSCNSRYAILEEQVKSVVQKLEKKQPISGKNIELFLSWLDKVRVGVWLGYSLLNKNHLGLKPHFHIDQRLDAADRLVGIFHVRDDQKGLGFGVTDTPLSHLMPSCITLRINSMYVVNLSTNCLVSKTLGLPYISWLNVEGVDQKISAKIKSGSKRIERVLDIKRLPPRGLYFAQAIRPKVKKDWVGNETIDDHPEPYHSEYCRNLYIRGGGDRTDIFMQSQGSLRKINFNTPNNIMKYSTVNQISQEQLFQVAITILEIQRDMFVSHRPKTFRKSLETLYLDDQMFSFLVSSQNKYIEILRNRVRQDGGWY